jgi:cytochrome c biogenesis protein CcdA
MGGFWIGAFSALWLGILTSVSPCPLATNIVAISFLSKKVAHPRLVFLSGIAYTLGRMLSYVVLGYLIIKSLFSVPAVSNFLQEYMNKAFGPILILTGLFLIDVLRFNMPAFSLSHKHQERLADSGIGGSLILGAFFALAFCPFSAALFFGSLIPLALDNKAGVILPFIYGIGTGLPVLAFVVAISLGVKSLSHWFKKLSLIELYMRKITGSTFIAVGIYYGYIYLLKG